MPDFRSVEELDINREGQRVGTLRRLPRGCEFRYEEAFLKSDERPIALHLPKTGAPMRLEGATNLPTYFAGLLPEGIMFVAVRRLIGSAPDDLFAILAATGAEAIGDVDVRVPGEPERKNSMTLGEAAAQIDDLLHGTQFPLDRVAAISGVQPKLSLGQFVGASRTSKYIAKFQSPDFPALLENEYAFTQLARRCRVNTSQVELRSGVLILKRFDRVFDRDSGSIRKLHVEDLLQVMDLFPNSKYSMEYIDLLTAMADLGVAKATLLDALRLYVFSYIIGNGDLHAKNVSLIQDYHSGQWSLSPAYDLLSTLPYMAALPRADAMALALDDENFGRFSVEEYIHVGTRFDLPDKAVSTMVQRTAVGVLKYVSQLASDGINTDVIDLVILRASSLIRGS